MAKWKNALLISTIVAPVALGASPIGSALADAVNSIGDRPDITDVTIHKKLNTKDASSKGNYYWGNGQEAASNVFTSDKGWKDAGENYEFTAFRLPTDVIKSQGYDTGDKPNVSTGYVISDQTIIDAGYTKVVDEKPVADRDAYIAAAGTDAKVLYGNIASLTWNKVISVEQPSTTGDKAPINAPGAAKSSYTFGIDESSTGLSTVTQLTQFKAYLAAAAENNGQNWKGDLEANVGGYQLKTNDKSTLTFDNLQNDEWVIFETANPSGSTKIEMAVPMVLNLPMVQPDGSAWFGSKTGGDGTPAINLYPKDYILNGDLTVEKLDVNDAAVKGAEFILIDGQDSDGNVLDLSQLRADIADGKKYTVTEDSQPVDKTFVQLSTAQAIAVLKDDYNLTVLDPDNDLTTTDQFVSTGVDGKAMFTNVKPDHTYFTMETYTPSAYDEIGVIQQVTTTTNATDLTDVNEDGQVYFTGGVYKVRNLPKTTIDKTIAVNEQIDTNSGEALDVDDDLNIFEDNDFVTGVSRGEHFQYKVDAAFDKFLTGDVKSLSAGGSVDNQNGYNIFKIVDQFDPQIDITSFQIGTTVGGTYQPLYLVKLTVDGNDQALDGGFSGNDGETVDYGYLIYEYNADGTLQKNPTDLSKYITISGHTSAYSNPNGQSVTGTPGELTVKLETGASGTNDPADFHDNLVAQKFVSTLTAGEKTGDVTLVMNAQTNSSAAVNRMNNKATLTSQTVNGTPNSPDDNSKTFNAGWEFVKTDSEDKRLFGAGFDLSRKLASGDQLTQKDRLLNEASGIMNLRDPEGDLTDAAITALAKLAAQFGTGTGWYLGANGGTQDEQDLHTALEAYLKLSDDDQAVVANQTPVAEAMVDVLNGQLALIQGGRATDLYFAHLDEKGLPVEDMKTTSEMGDVLWTPYEALATTHYTNDQGYFQYCGLAMGPYTLTETVVPSGYDKVEPINFFVADQTLMGTTQINSSTGTITQDNPYSNAGDATPDEKANYAAWEKVKDAFNTANAGSTKFGLLNDKWSDNSIDGSRDTVALVEDAKDNGGVAQILNYEKSIFPLVGGLGTLFAVIAGLLAMGLALLKRKKDMKNEA